MSRNRQHYTFTDRHDELLIKRQGELAGQGFILERLNNCEVYLLDHTGQVQVDDCFNCRILVGPCDGAVFLRDCSDCFVGVACRQLRTRDCKNITFSLYCATQPSIETSSAIRFTCWRFAYPHLTTHFRAARLDPQQNTWSKVYDFNATGSIAERTANYQVDRHSYSFVYVPLILNGEIDEEALPQNPVPNANGARCNPFALDPDSVPLASADVANIAAAPAFSLSQPKLPPVITQVPTADTSSNQDAAMPAVDVALTRPSTPMTPETDGFVLVKGAGDVFPIEAEGEPQSGKDTDSEAGSPFLPSFPSGDELAAAAPSLPTLSSEAALIGGYKPSRLNVGSSHFDQHVLSTASSVAAIAANDVLPQLEKKHEEDSGRAASTELPLAMFTDDRPQAGSHINNFSTGGGSGSMVYVASNVSGDFCQVDVEHDIMTEEPEPLPSASPVAGDRSGTCVVHGFIGENYDRESFTVLPEPMVATLPEQAPLQVTQAVLVQKVEESQKLPNPVNLYVVDRHGGKGLGSAVIERSDQASVILKLPDWTPPAVHASPVPCNAVLGEDNAVDTRCFHHSADAPVPQHGAEGPEDMCHNAYFGVECAQAESDGHEDEQFTLVHVVSEAMSDIPDAAVVACVVIESCRRTTSESDQLGLVADASIRSDDAMAKNEEGSHMAGRDKVATGQSEHAAVVDGDTAVLDEQAPVADDYTVFVDERTAGVDGQDPVVDEYTAFVDSNTASFDGQTLFVDEYIAFVDDHTLGVDEQTPFEIVEEHTAFVDEHTAAVDGRTQCVQVFPAFNEHTAGVGENTEVADDLTPVVDDFAAFVDENTAGVAGRAPLMDESSANVDERAASVDGHIGPDDAMAKSFNGSDGSIVDWPANQVKTEGEVDQDGEKVLGNRAPAAVVRWADHDESYDVVDDGIDLMDDCDNSNLFNVAPAIITSTRVPCNQQHSIQNTATAHYTVEGQDNLPVQNVAAVQDIVDTQDNVESPDSLKAQDSTAVQAAGVSGVQSVAACDVERPPEEHVGGGPSLPAANQEGGNNTRADHHSAPSHSRRCSNISGDTVFFFSSQGDSSNKHGTSTQGSTPVSPWDESPAVDSHTVQQANAAVFDATNASYASRANSASSCVSAGAISGAPSMTDCDSHVSSIGGSIQSTPQVIMASTVQVSTPRHYLLDSTSYNISPVPQEPSQSSAEPTPCGVQTASVVAPTNGMCGTTELTNAIVTVVISTQSPSPLMNQPNSISDISTTYGMEDTRTRSGAMGPVMRSTTAGSITAILVPTASDATDSAWDELCNQACISPVPVGMSRATSGMGVIPESFWPGAWTRSGTVQGTAPQLGTAASSTLPLPATNTTDSGAPQSLSHVNSLTSKEDAMQVGTPATASCAPSLRPTTSGLSVAALQSPASVFPGKLFVNPPADNWDLQHITSISKPMGLPMQCSSGNSQSLQPEAALAATSGPEPTKKVLYGYNSAPSHTKSSTPGHVTQENAGAVPASTPIAAFESAHVVGASPAWGFADAGSFQSSAAGHASVRAAPVLSPVVPANVGLASSCSAPTQQKEEEEESIARDISCGSNGDARAAWLMRNADDLTNRTKQEAALRAKTQDAAQAYILSFKQARDLAATARLQAAREVEKRQNEVQAQQKVSTLCNLTATRQDKSVERMRTVLTRRFA